MCQGKGNRNVFVVHERGLYVEDGNVFHGVFDSLDAVAAFLAAQLVGEWNWKDEDNGLWYVVEEVVVRYA